MHMTFDPSNVLISGQRFFLQHLVVIGHSWATWPLVDPSCPLHDLWPHHCTILRSGVLPTKFGFHTAFLCNLTTGWPWDQHTGMLVSGLTPADPCMTFHPIIALHFSRGFFPPNLVAIKGIPIKQLNLWMTFHLWWGLKPCGPIPYPNAKFQLHTSEQDKAHSRTHILSHILITYRLGYFSSTDHSNLNFLKV